MNPPSLGRPLARVALVALVTVAPIAPARAQLPTEAEVRQASAHAQKGRAHFDAGRYQKAVQELEAAYKLEPDPELQYQIAEAERLNDADALAIAAYRRYLELAPDGANARNAHRHLRDLGAETKTKGKPKPQAKLAPPPPKPAPVVAPKAEARPEAPASAHDETPPPPRLDLTATAPPPRHARAPLSKRNIWIIAGASAAAATVIVLGVGLGVGLRAHETVFMEVRP